MTPSVQPSLSIGHIHLRQYGRRFKQVGLFCTEGGNGDQRAFDELSRLCGKTPLTTLTVTERQLPDRSHMGRLNEFVARMAS